jgi:hypothetical protein
MPVEATSLFTQVIQAHLELKRRNAELDAKMPIDRYRLEDTFSNHPLFKSEEQARLEETMNGTEVAAHGPPTVLRWPGEDSVEVTPAVQDEDSGLWGRSRDFDWGD